MRASIGRLIHKMLLGCYTIIQVFLIGACRGLIVHIIDPILLLIGWISVLIVYFKWHLVVLNILDIA